MEAKTRVYSKCDSGGEAVSPGFFNGLVSSASGQVKEREKEERKREREGRETAVRDRERLCSV